jgi:phosphoserine phosphatase
VTLSFVLTLISSPAQPALDPDVIATARAALTEAGAAGEEMRWLAPAIACDLFFDGISAPVAIDAVRQYLGDLAIDICAQPILHRRKSLLIADMDSTIIGQECIVELADYAGRRDEVAAITERAMMGELAFADALAERARMLAGLSLAEMERAYAERIRLNPGAATLVRTMRANGALTALVSGGFTFFTKRVAKMAGFHSDQANDLEMEDGKVTGNILPPILDRSAKQIALEKIAKENAIDVIATLAVGDGANDIAMLQVAGLGVAYRARPLVAAAAKAQINHADLTGLLYLQGYCREEFEN